MSRNIKMQKKKKREKKLTRKHTKDIGTISRLNKRTKGTDTTAGTRERKKKLFI